MVEIAYNGIGTGLYTIGYVPLAIGTGLVTAGSYLIDAGDWMQNKGAECKLYAAGLKALREGELDKAKIDKLAKKNNWNFKESLINSYLQKMKAQSKDKSQDEPQDDQEESQKAQDEQDESESQDESQDNIAAAMKAAMVLV